MAQDNRQDNPSNRESQSSQSSRDAQSSRESQSKPTQSSSSFSGQQSSSQSGGNYSFRCADAGQKDCTWETKGSSEDEVLRNVEKHGREKHNISSFIGETRDRVRNAIRRVAA